MGRIWKRLWIPAVFWILTIITFIACDQIPNEDWSGGIGALCLFVFFPLAVFATIWAIVSGLRLSANYAKDPETTLREFDHSRTGQLKKDLAESKKAYQDLSPALKKRASTFKTIGSILIVLCVYLPIALHGSTFSIIIATILLIIGVTLFMMANPNTYNNSSDGFKMIGWDPAVTIEMLCEAYKDQNTVYGSPYLAQLSTMKRPVMVFGPAKDGYYVYAYLNRSGDLLYIGGTPLGDSIKVHLTEPLYPCSSEQPQELAACLIDNINSTMFKAQLFESLSQFIQTRTPAPFPEIKPTGFYCFDEQFKLTGQQFDLTTLDGAPVFHIDGTMPLKTFHIYDTTGHEVFKVSKEIFHTLATYRFYENGTFLGVLEKELSLVKDRFALEIKEGEIALEQLAGTVGYNYRVTFNGHTIGLVLDNLELDLRNFVFDNSIVAAYDNSFLPLLTAMAVMVAREIARDEEAARNR